MITVDEALSILDNFPIRLQTEKIPFEEALGRILAKPIIADRDFPPYDRVAMDGIAIEFERYAAGQRIFTIEKTIPAGTPQARIEDHTACVEIMTGAVLTEGCDTVIPYEEVSIENGIATINGTVIAKQHVHRQGNDRKKHDVLVESGSRVAPVDIGIAATVGASELEVFRKPDVCLVSTGDELVPVGGIPAPHQIRTSNSYALMAALHGYFGNVSYRHLMDDETQVYEAITELLQHFQILIFIGGSSMGKFDFLPSALRNSGLEEHFYRIKQRPGKPFWFGSHNNQFVFSLPGNPVSCYLCLEKYYKYWLNKSLGYLKNNETAQLAQDFVFEPDLTYFLQVKLMNDTGVTQAIPIVGGGSGDHSNLADVDGFLELPRGRSHFKAGESFTLLRFR